MRGPLPVAQRNVPGPRRNVPTLLTPVLVAFIGSIAGMDCGHAPHAPTSRAVLQPQAPAPSKPASEAKFSLGNLPGDTLARKFWSEALVDLLNPDRGLVDAPLDGCDSVRQFLGNTRDLVSASDAVAILARLGGIRESWLQRRPHLGLEHPATARLFRQLTGLRLLRATRPMLRLEPGALRWAAEHLLPAPDTKIRGLPAKKIYRCAFQRLARAYVAIYLDLAKRGLRTEADRFRHDVLEGGQSALEWAADRYQDDETYGIGEYWNNSSDAVASIRTFWLRRQVDGTAPVVLSVLMDVFRKYDPEFARRIHLPTNSTNGARPPPRQRSHASGPTH